MKKLYLFLFVFIIGLCAGCASTKSVKAYSGNDRSADQIATVIVPASVEVRHANDMKLPRVTTLLMEKQYTIATLPGAQEWSVRYYAPLAGGYSPTRPPR